MLPRRGVHHEWHAALLPYVVHLVRPRALALTSRPAYSFLDPHTEHARLAGWIVGIAAAEAVLFAIVRYAMLLRHLLVVRVGSSSRQGAGYFAGSEADDEEKGRGRGGGEGLEDWEDLGRPSFGSGARGVAL